MRRNIERAVATVGFAAVFAVLLVPGAAGAESTDKPPVLIPGQAQQPVADESPNDLFLTVGKTLVVNSALPIERVSVGFGEIAEATAVGIREIVLNGKAPGETSLILWQQGGSKLFFDVRVEASPFASNSRVEALRRELSTELSGQSIDATLDNDLIFLRGTVKDLTSAQRALAIASAMGKVVNLLRVEVPSAEPQILLKVKFASVDRNQLSQYGANIFNLGQAGTIGSSSTQQFSPPLISSNGGSGSGSGSGGGSAQGSLATATLSNMLNLFFFKPDVPIGATIQALQTKGIAEVLAEPNLLAYNGKQASFLAGGEFPYPVVQGGTTGGSTAVTVQFRQFGVRLNFIPTITPRGTIRLQVSPEVSSLDFANGLTISGFTVPAIAVRNVNTEVELGEHQSFVVGGLLDNRESETFSKIPFIGSIPILGKFFQSKNKNRTNTELMVIVTPEIVRPTPANIAIETPNFPVPFLPPNSRQPMSTPALTITGPVPVTPPTSSIPVETLVQSYEEKPLSVSGTSGVFGQGQSLGASGSTTPAPAAPAVPTK